MNSSPLSPCLISNLCRSGILSEMMKCTMLISTTTAQKYVRLTFCRSFEGSNDIWVYSSQAPAVEVCNSGLRWKKTCRVPHPKSYKSSTLRDQIMRFVPRGAFCPEYIDPQQCSLIVVCCRFGRKATSDRLYTLVNSSAKSKNKTAARKAFLSVWRASDCSLHQTRVVASRPITVMDVSPDGLHLALGGSDLSVSVWNAQTLLVRRHEMVHRMRGLIKYNQPLRLVRAAHDFPATALRFSPSGQMVISTSADNTLRVIPVEKTWAGVLSIR